MPLRRALLPPRQLWVRCDIRPARPTRQELSAGIGLGIGLTLDQHRHHHVLERGEIAEQVWNEAEPQLLFDRGQFSGFRRLLLAPSRTCRRTESRAPSRMKQVLSPSRCPDDATNSPRLPSDRAETPMGLRTTAKHLTESYRENCVIRADGLHRVRAAARARIDRWRHGDGETRQHQTATSCTRCARQCDREYTAGGSGPAGAVTLRKVSREAAPRGADQDDITAPCTRNSARWP